MRCGHLHQCVAKRLGQARPSDRCGQQMLPFGRTEAVLATGEVERLRQVGREMEHVAEPETCEVLLGFARSHAAGPRLANATGSFCASRGNFQVDTIDLVIGRHD
jgi:hypothetical protein